MEEKLVESMTNVTAMVSALADRIKAMEGLGPGPRASGWVGPPRDEFVSWVRALPPASTAGDVEERFLTLLTVAPGAEDRRQLRAWRVLHHKLHEQFASWEVAILAIEEPSLFESPPYSPTSLEVLQWVAALRAAGLGLAPRPNGAAPSKGRRRGGKKPPSGARKPPAVAGAPTGVKKEGGR